MVIASYSKALLAIHFFHTVVIRAAPPNAVHLHSAKRSQTIQSSESSPEMGNVLTVGCSVLSSVCQLL